MKESDPEYQATANCLTTINNTAEDLHMWHKRLLGVSLASWAFDISYESYRVANHEGFVVSAPVISSIVTFGTVVFKCFEKHAVKESAELTAYMIEQLDEL